ncbi:MAG: anthranilate synthase component I family protein [Planctomycetes bacterium]|nr:anthranilate synthase component I family protein [Planctomycetota bacterium]
MPRVRSIDLPLAPTEVIDLWSIDRPLLALPSGGNGRWSIFATPEDWFTVPADGRTPDPLAALDRVLASTRIPGSTATPFPGGWIGFLSYDLGAVIEPSARNSAAGARPSAWPLIQLAHCSAALVHDRELDRWLEIGDADLAADLADEPTTPAADPQIGSWSSSPDPDTYLAAVARTLDWIAAGDIFQANVTRRLTARFAGSTRRLARRALTAAGAPHGAYLELPDGRAIVSMSPELFLDVDPATRRVVTRPIKGTRPARTDPAELLRSEKDTAELNMIIDLMRNDLGRVCEYGSVRVPGGRTVETHPTVHHGVATVEGRLRVGVTAGDLLGATFPAGSITGAPKIRAMQIIDELEPTARGPSFGSIGFFGDDGRIGLNVAIRTILLTAGEIAYAVGGGIVADSNPIAEYRESQDKTAVLHLATGSCQLRTCAGSSSRFVIADRHRSS